jgi:hypothetical protein
MVSTNEEALNNLKSQMDSIEGLIASDPLLTHADLPHTKNAYAELTVRLLSPNPLTEAELVDVKLFSEHLIKIEKQLGRMVKTAAAVTKAADKHGTETRKLTKLDQIMKG